MSVSENLEFNNLLIKAAQEGVSDLHLSTGSNVKAKIDNKLHDWPGLVISDDFLKKNIVELLSDKQKEYFETHGSIVFSYDFVKDLRFKVNLFRQEGNFSAILRFISGAIKQPTVSGLPKIIERVAEIDRGLVIVSGVLGSGKTTTLASMIEYINQTNNKSIVTLEKPIEYVFKNSKSLVEQREVPFDTPSFSQGTRDMLSMQVDVVVISQLTDSESAINILELSEKSLVLLESSSHSITDAINDFITVFDSNRQAEIRPLLAKNLVAVFNQILVLRKGQGMMPIVEVLLNTNAVAAAVAENRLSRIPDLIVMSGHEGMISKERSLAELVKAGEVMLEEALKHVDDKEEFKQMILK